MPVVRLDLSYDGSGFHGFARQPGLRTVQGEIEDALERVAGIRVATTCAGRTDRGVHARHQVVSFPVDSAPDPERLRRSLDGVLGPEVSVWASAIADDAFDARFSPVWRRYRYFIDPRPAADPLTRSWVWHLGKDVDLDSMSTAAAGFVGEHDFATFCRQRPGSTTVRVVQEAGWSRQDGRCVFDVRARSFCHQMVRSMVGFCVDVGLGRAKIPDTAAVMAARDRQAVGTVAPPHGLILWQVGF